MAFQAGTAFVPVMPSFRGFQQAIARHLGDSGRRSGRQFTDRFGDEVERSAPSVAGQMRNGLSRLNAVMTGVGVAAGAALTAAVTKGLDASQAQAKLANQLGATGKQSERFGRIAGQLYSRAYGESMDDVRGAIGAVVSSIDGMRGANEGAVKQMTKRALTLASTFDLDVARAVQVVGQAVRTGLVKDAQQGFDLLMVSLQRVPAAVREDLLDALDEYGPFMDQIGIRGERAFEILVQAAEKGMYGLDKTGDAFKEITLRIASDSDAVDEALKRLGTTQGEVQTAFAKGGSAAKVAFERIVDGLLKVKDPGERAKLAIELFGTPIEDLNTKDIPAFLKSLSGTSVELGKVEGATDRAGKAMEETAGAKVESFKRSLEQNLAQVVAEDVIPKLEQLGRVASSVGITPSGVVQAGIALTGLAAAFKTVSLAATIATTRVLGHSAASLTAAAATRTYTAAMRAWLATNFVAGWTNINRAMAANAPLMTRLGAALRSQILLWRQQAAATGVSTGRIILNAAAQKIAAAATRTWAIAQGILNAVMRANPLILIVTAIMLVVGAVILAYKRFDWFRNLVDRVWAGIQSAISTAWGFIKPIFDQIASILVTVVGTALRWYWAYVKFVFTTVWTIIKTAWAIIQPIFNTIASVVRGVLGGAFIFFRNLIKIVWIAIQIYIKIAWTLIKGYFDLIKLYVTKVLAPVFRWLYNNVIKPVWNGIRAAIGIAWGIIKGIFNAIRGHLAKTLGPAFTLLRSVAGKAWNGLKATIQTVWNSGIKPAFDKVRSAVGKVRDAFRTAVDGIKRIWDRLKGIAKTPVNFVIGLYNDGIVKLVNKIAGFAGIKTRLDKIPKFARGGIMPGYSPGVDSLIAAVSPGESIFRPEFTRAVGSAWVTRANDVARKSGVEGVRKWLSGPDAIGGEGLAFARGGVVPRFAGNYAFGGIIGRFVKGVRDFSIGNVAKSAKGLLDKVLGGLVPGSGVFRDVVAAIPAWIKDNVLKWITKSIDSGVGGPPVQRALRYARAQAGKPYVWGGVGPGGFDCSGFMSALTNVIKGKPPNRRLFTTFSFTGAANGPVGFRRNQRSGFTVGVTNAGVGHMAGTLGGVNVESRGSAGVVVGPRARGTADGLFGMRYGLKYDDGGLLQRGLTLAYHGARQPDRVLTDSQWQSIHAAARGGDGPSTVNNFYPRTLDMTVRDLEVLQRKQDARARIGRPR